MRRATVDDATGVAAVLNEVISGGRRGLLDTPFSDTAERAYIAALPGRAFIHVAEMPDQGIVAFQSLEPWAGLAAHTCGHVATMGTYVTERYAGAASAGASLRNRLPTRGSWAS